MTESNFNLQSLAEYNLLKNRIKSKNRIRTRTEIMIKHFSKEALGYTNHGWLKSSHHFSFANYDNPKRISFGVLRVVNDDWVKADTGFGAHPHKNMEIISYIRSGSMTHQDSEGNTGVTQAGEIQVMRAGTGIVHSEYNHSKEPLTFYQIWIETNQFNAKPSWQSKKIPTKIVKNSLHLLVSGFKKDKNKALFIHQEAKIYGGKLKKGTKIDHAIEQQIYILTSKGLLTINDTTKNQSFTLNKGDGAEVTNAQKLTITALTDCEVVIIDVPVH